jgi:parallel beta-helix repeat protein
MRGNKIRYNLIHDIFGHHLLGGKWLPPVITYGIYLDDYTSTTEVVGNITYRTPKGGIFIHDGQDNLVENNMFLETYMEMITLLRNRPELERTNMGVYGQAVRRNVLRKNIMASNYDTSTVYFLDTLENAEGRIDLDTNVFEDNLIWCYDKPVMVETHFYSKKITWEQWLELGYEKGSIVADPKFMDRTMDDFTLDKDSPALTLGFEPIPVDKIGLYKSENRKVWPIVETEGIREHPSDMVDPE